MSAQRLSRRKVAQLAIRTGLNITRAWSNGGYWMNCYIDLGDGQHEHRPVNIVSYEVDQYGSAGHLSSCAYYGPWPEWPVGDPVTGMPPVTP